MDNTEIPTNLLVDGNIDVSNNVIINGTFTVFKKSDCVEHLEK